MPKIIDHAQRREDIIDVAWGLIVEGGIEAVTMREVASRAGFANGALRHTFSGKDEIVKAAYERALLKIQDSLLAQVKGLQGIAALEASLRATLPTTIADPSSSRVLLSFWERVAFNPTLDEDYSQHVQVWTDGYLQHVTEGRALGEIVTELPDEQIVNEAILLNIGATVLHVVSPTHLKAATLEAQVTDFLARLRTP